MIDGGAVGHACYFEVVIDVVAGDDLPVVVYDVFDFEYIDNAGDFSDEIITNQTDLIVSLI